MAAHNEEADGGKQKKTERTPGVGHHESIPSVHERGVNDADGTQEIRAGGGKKASAHSGTPIPASVISAVR